MNNIKFNQECLEAHNEYRAKHGAAPLVLSQKICEYSQNWAQKLANEDCGRYGQWTISHSNCFAHGYGENCAGALADYDGRRVTKMWYDEVKDYRFESGGFSVNTGHFTQVVWKESKEMGVGRATARSGNIYVVVNYAPAGNMQGAFQTNVLPPSNCDIPTPKIVEKALEKPVVESESAAAETSASEKDEIIKSLREQVAVLEKNNADLREKNLILQDKLPELMASFHVSNVSDDNLASAAAEEKERKKE